MLSLLPKVRPSSVIAPTTAHITILGMNIDLLFRAKLKPMASASRLVTKPRKAMFLREKKFSFTTSSSSSPLIASHINFPPIKPRNARTIQWAAVSM